MDMDAIAGGIGERFRHEAGDDTGVAGKRLHCLAERHQVVSGLHGRLVVQVDLKLSGAVFGAELDYTNALRCQCPVDPA